MFEVDSPIMERYERFVDKYEDEDETGFTTFVRLDDAVSLPL